MKTQAKFVGRVAVLFLGRLTQKNPEPTMNRMLHRIHPQKTYRVQRKVLHCQFALVILDKRPTDTPTNQIFR